MQNQRSKLSNSRGVRWSPLALVQCEIRRQELGSARFPFSGLDQFSTQYPMPQFFNKLNAGKEN